MSFYAMVTDGFGEGRFYVLSNLLGNTELLSGLRDRDAWVEKHPSGNPLIALYTRNGGGNRECYCEENGYEENGCTACRAAPAERHPLFHHFSNDDYDTTYGTYYYSLPPDLPPDVRLALEKEAQEPEG